MPIQDRARAWLERGSTRNPGPHLDRLPLGLDLSGISLAEGLRAAVASGAVLLTSVWFHSYPLLIIAFAANLTCFCDVGGPLRTRIVALTTFTVEGALCWAVFGLLRNLDWIAVVPFAAMAIFAGSMARVWGLAAQTVGNLSIVTVALALDKPLDAHGATVLCGSFIVGGLWAVLLTLVIWRIQPTRPAEQAVETVWMSLAALTRDLRRIASAPATEAQWDAHARGHRRATRLAIEDARLAVADAVRIRGPLSEPVQRLEIRIEAAETIFAALIALSDVLEGQRPSVRLKSAKALRLMRPLLVLLSKGMLENPGRFNPVLTRLSGEVAEQRAIAPLIDHIVDGLRIAMRVSLSAHKPWPAVISRGNLRDRFREAMEPLRDNLSWRSAILRHAVRATVVTVPAIIWSLIWPSPYAHWLTITVALTMQPYFSATSQRVIERIGGTVLGGLIGAAIAFVPQTPLIKAALLVPLSIIGFSARQVSYGAFIACLTPLVVVLFDVATPGHVDSTIAAMRLFYTISGGLLAVAACAVLWPSWEPDRLAAEIGNALRVYGQFADAAFTARRFPEARPDAEAARRNAGVASNNLEASLSRALQEPHHGQDRQVEAALVVDAAFRRLGASLITLQHETDLVATAGEASIEKWRVWMIESLAALAEGRGVETPAPAAAPDSTLSRLRRAIDVIAAALQSRSPKPFP